MNKSGKPLKSFATSELHQMLDEDFEIVCKKIFEHDDTFWNAFVEDCLQQEKFENREMTTADQIFALIVRYRDTELSEVLGAKASVADYFMFLRRRAYAELKAKKLV